MELTLLKGHLLIEEFLSDLIKVKLSDYNPLGLKVEKRMMFNQKLNLCWALTRKELPDSIWIALKKLNSIRNDMAHEVEPKGINKKITELTTQVLPNSGFSKESYEGRELLCTIAWMHAALSGTAYRQSNS
ncbi:hypothetical protein JK628_06855 [Shewanella sp. KX20019]|uniref:hypothetical protein n=1 Tax=Shewanella sp. KX20019 TaxID=2803864 RepID=UPI0019285089|nr:hypothetical protein [Shewanella sp. KX20019]QQX81574.1 hypothetical protein JK628_06855 [Shewanella sp. KX20019]